MQMLDMNETIDLLAKANSVRLYGYVLGMDENNFLRRALDLRVRWAMKRGKPKKTWLRPVMEQSRKVVLKKVMPITVQDRL